MNDSAPFDFFSGGGAGPMTVKALKGLVKFDKTNSDGVSVQGTLPGLPAGLDVTGKTLDFSIGGASTTFTLDAKGKAKALNGNVSLSLKPSKRNKVTKKVDFLGGDVGFKLKLSKGAYADDWADEGALSSLETKSTPVPFVLNLTLGGKPFTTNVTTTYKGKAGKSGSFSFKAPKP